MKTRGLSAVLVALTVCLSLPAPALAAIGATAKVKVLLQRSTFVAASDTTTNICFLKNASTGTLVGPSRVVLESLDNRDLAVLNPDGEVVSLTYSPGGKLQAIATSDGDYSFAHHPTSHYVSSIGAPGGGGVAFTYGGNLLLSQAWTGDVAGRVDPTFDNNFRVVSRSVSGVDAIACGYDDDGLLVQAGSLAIARSSQNHLITGTTLGSVTDTRGYNSFGEPASARLTEIAEVRPEKTSGRAAAIGGGWGFLIGLIAGTIGALQSSDEDDGTEFSFYPYAGALIGWVVGGTIDWLIGVPVGAVKGTEDINRLPPPTESTPDRPLRGEGGTP